MIGKKLENNLNTKVSKQYPDAVGTYLYGVRRNAAFDGGGVDEVCIDAHIIPYSNSVPLYDTNGRLTSEYPSTYSKDVANVLYVKDKIDDAIVEVTSYVDNCFKTLDLAIIVQSLPASGEANRLYLVPKTEPDSNDFYDEYVWEDNKWEYLGTRSVEIDFSIEDIVNEVIDRLPKYNGEVEDV